jgi:hypothetical protein
MTRYFSYGQEDIAFRREFEEHRSSIHGPYDIIGYFYNVFDKESTRSKYPNLRNSNTKLAIFHGLTKEYCPFVLHVNLDNKRSIYANEIIKNMISEIDDNINYVYAMERNFEFLFLLRISNENIANMLRIAYGFDYVNETI